jgi:hypothetical protein
MKIFDTGTSCLTTTRKNRQIHPVLPTANMMEKGETTVAGKPSSSRRKKHLLIADEE